MDLYFCSVVNNSTTAIYIFFLFSFLMKSVAGWLIACCSCVCVKPQGRGSCT
jgi:hypothetical protein